MAIMDATKSTLSYAANITTDANIYGSAFTSIVVNMFTKSDTKGTFLKGTWDWTMNLQRWDGTKWVTKATKTGYVSATSSSSRSFTRTDTGTQAGDFRIAVDLVRRAVTGVNPKQFATLYTRSFKVSKQ